MIYLKTPQEIEKMRLAADLTSRALGHIAQFVAPGVTTNKIEIEARQFIRDHGGRPSCLGFEGFPAAVCYEVNEVVVHGFPSNIALRDGDILGLDIVVELDGFHGDMCYTFPVGNVSADRMRLLRVTKECLAKGIEACREGNRLGDIGAAVQRYAEANGYTVVREMTGHGIGRSMHEDPMVPNYGKPRQGVMLRNGMCLCIEPMINMGKRNVRILPDGWTCVTRDGQPSAHYEHTVAIVDGRTEVLTTFDYVKQVLGDKFI